VIKIELSDKLIFLLFSCRNRDSRRWRIKLQNFRNWNGVIWTKNGFSMHFTSFYICFSVFNHLRTGPHFSESPGARAHKCLDSVSSITWTAGRLLKTVGSL
jgi:hypothetical protein